VHSPFKLLFAKYAMAKMAKNYFNRENYWNSGNLFVRLSVISKLDPVLFQLARRAGWHKTGSDRVSVQDKDRRSGIRLVAIIQLSAVRHKLFWKLKKGHDF